MGPKETTVYSVQKVNRWICLGSKQTEKGRRGGKGYALAVGTGVEDGLPFISGAHLSGVVCHSLVPTSRAAPVNLGSNWWVNNSPY